MIRGTFTQEGKIVCEISGSTPLCRSQAALAETHPKPLLCWQLSLPLCVCVWWGVGAGGYQSGYPSTSICSIDRLSIWTRSRLWQTPSRSGEWFPQGLCMLGQGLLIKLSWCLGRAVQNSQLPTYILYIRLPCLASSSGVSISCL